MKGLSQRHHVLWLHRAPGLHKLRREWSHWPHKCNSAWKGARPTESGGEGGGNKDPKNKTTAALLNRGLAGPSQTGRDQRGWSAPLATQPGNPSFSPPGTFSFRSRDQASLTAPPRLKGGFTLQPPQVPTLMAPGLFPQRVMGEGGEETPNPQCSPRAHTRNPGRRSSSYLPWAGFSSRPTSPFERDNCTGLPGVPSRWRQRSLPHAEGGVQAPAAGVLRNPQRCCQCRPHLPAGHLSHLEPKAGVGLWGHVCQCDLG